MTKEIDVKRGGGEPRKSILEERIETLAAVEAEREKREQPRKDFLAGKGGEASDHFDITTNRDAIETFTGKSAHEEVEDFSESAREKWLRTGELPEKKPNGKVAEKKAEAAQRPERPRLTDFVKDGQVDQAGYDAALDKYEVDKTAFEKEQAAKPNGKEQPQTEEQKQREAKLAEAAARGELDKELYDETEKQTETWFTEPAHEEAVKTFPQRWQAMQAALTPEQKSAVEASVKAIGQSIPADLNRFMLEALARTKNMGAVYFELMRHPGLLLSINHDWMRSANWQKSPDALKLRINTDKAIRYMLKQFDKRAGSAGNGAKANGAERKTDNLTRAGRPPLEAAGASSSPADDGSSDAAWRRKDLSVDARGELYRERKNQEEIDARRKRSRRR